MAPLVTWEMPYEDIYGVLIIDTCYTMEMSPKYPQVKALREERQPWSAKVRVSFGQRVGATNGVPDRKRQIPKCPLFEHVDSLIFNVVRVVKTGVWDVDDLFSVARGSEAGW